MPVQLVIETLGEKFKDYRDEIPGDSYDWGFDVVATDIRYLTFHHSVTPQTAKNDGNWKAECDKIANLHLDRGWGGVGYRLIICSDGTVAYVGDLGATGSAVGDHNDITFSVCLVGDFTKELPTAAQVHSAHLLSLWFLYNMPQYPNLNDWLNVIGHKEFAVIFNQPQWATACPGSNWKSPGDNLYSRIRDDNFSGYPNPQPPVETPPTEPQPDYRKLYEDEKKAHEATALRFTLEKEELVRNHNAKLGQIKNEALEVERHNQSVLTLIG